MVGATHYLGALLGLGPRVIRAECDAPGCVMQCVALRVDALGRVHLPPPWVIFGGGEGSRTLTVCKAAHVVPALASAANALTARALPAE